MGLFSQIPEINWDYTKLKETIDTLTGETIRRRAMHVILYDAATGNPIASIPGGSTATAAPTTTTTTTPMPVVVTQRVPAGGSLTIDSVSLGKPLSSVDYLCQSVQITSVRSDWTDNTGRIGIGDATAWYASLSPMGVQSIEAPIGGILNLKNVIIYGSVIGDQVKFLVLNSI